MTAKTTRLLKEARPLFLPWCAVTIAALLPLVNRRDFTESISLIGFWAGIPLLATLSLGNEFQHRTLSLLLAQPVGRMEIWREKLSVTVVAVLSTALVFFFVWRALPSELDALGFEFAGAWILGVFASATFWTLFTRSTLGGVVMNAGIHAFIILTTWNHLVRRFYESGEPLRVNVGILPILTISLCYAVAMLWLGGRKLARFQVTGGAAGDDLLMAGPDLMPGALAEWFRCRPTGALLNLIRKELRLLRPLWLITLLAVVGWTCLTMFGMVPKPGSTKMPSVAAAVAFGMAVLSTLILAVLAGSLSLGEERMSGTHGWHMTLPVSVRRQWLIKLLMALLAGVVCAALLPELVLIAGGLPLMFVDPHLAMVWMLLMLLLSFASFWCTCALNGTVRAAMWVFPVLGALGIAGQFGGWLARQLMARGALKLVLFLGFPFIMEASKFPFDYIPQFSFIDPVSNSTYSFDSGGEMGSFYLVASWFSVPVLFFAMVQSCRLFRAQAQESLLSLARNLLPLTTMTFLLSFLFIVSGMLVFQAHQQLGTMVGETHKAIEKIQSGIPNLDATHLLELTLDDLAKASPLSENTRRWLRNSRITLAPDNSRHTTFHYSGETFYSLYIATIYLASGSKCTVYFHGQPLPDRYYDGVCE